MNDTLHDEMMRVGFHDGPIDPVYAKHLLIKGADALAALRGRYGRRCDCNWYENQVCDVCQGYGQPLFDPVAPDALTVPETPGDPLDSLPDTYEDVKWAAEQEFLAASVAVWQEIDRLTDESGTYPGLPQSSNLRIRERAAWDAYKPWLTSGSSPETERCGKRVRGVYGVASVCARPPGHRGKCNSIHDHRDWPASPSGSDPETCDCVIHPDGVRETMADCPVHDPPVSSRVDV